VEATQYAPSLTEHERDLRDRFVSSYLEDFNEVRAAIRIGYAESYAREFGPRFMREPYVLNKLAEEQKRLGITDDKDRERIQIIAMLKREAMRDNAQGGTGSSRVSALVQLSKILGIEAPAKVEVTEKNPPALDHLDPVELEEMKRKIYGPAVPAYATTH